MADACDHLSISPLAALMVVKSTDGTDVELSHLPDVWADSYNTWFVSARERLPEARLGGSGQSPADCLFRPTPDCTHQGAVDPAAEGPRLYYQVRGACQGQEAAE
jgi:hypothetical protein